MKWNLGLDGRKYSELEGEKRQMFPGCERYAEADWCSLASLVLEVIGIRRAIRMGDPQLWSQALSELETLPVPPLNLPLPVWELYLAQPFGGVTLHLSDGRSIRVPDWALVYYSWHNSSFVIPDGDVVRNLKASEILGGAPIRSTGSQTTVLERLRWLGRERNRMTFVVRTRYGDAIIVEGTGCFHVDPSGTWLAVTTAERDEPPTILPVADITEVVLPEPDTRSLLQQLQHHLKASPFLPVRICLVTDACYVLKKPTDVLLTSGGIHFAEGATDSGVCDSVLFIPFGWVDRFEPLPA